MNPYSRFHFVPLFVSVLIALSSGSSAGEDKALATAPTEWRGIHLDVTRIERIAPDRLLVAVRVRADATAPGTTLLGFRRAPYPGEFPPDEQEDVIESYSLGKSVLKDEATGVEFPASKQLPSSPFWGPMELASTLKPGEWIQMAVAFPAPPPPPPSAQNEEKPQKVSLVLPGARAPVTGLVLPK